jgi:hypothetical protein
MSEHWDPANFELTKTESSDDRLREALRILWDGYPGILRGDKYARVQEILEAEGMNRFHVPRNR